MTVFKYIKLNLSNMISKHLMILIMIVFSAIMTSLCLFFSYGLFINTRETIGKMEQDKYYYYYTYPAAHELPAKLAKLEEKIGDDLDHINLYIKVKDKNGEEHKASAASVLDSSEGVSHICRLSHLLESLVDNGTICFDGVEYRPEIFNAEKMYGDVALPLKSITDNAESRSIELYIKSQPTAARTDEINTLMAELFNAESKKVPEPRSLIDDQINHTFYAFSFIIVMIVVINLSMYFKYIINIRKKQIRILFICGAQRSQIETIYRLEAATELIIGYGIAYLIYNYLLLDIIVKYYPNFKDYYSDKLYLVTLLLYILGSMLILFLTLDPYVKKLIARSRGGAAE